MIVEKEIRAYLTLKEKFFDKLILQFNGPKMQNERQSSRMAPDCGIT
ncbi:hypothetical protein [Bacillus sp. 03113]|nr:hypothetical protein [Bacillus sp. 03113]